VIGTGALAPYSASPNKTTGHSWRYCCQNFSPTSRAINSQHTCRHAEDTINVAHSINNVDPTGRSHTVHISWFRRRVIIGTTAGVWSVHTEVSNTVRVSVERATANYEASAQSPGQYGFGSKQVVSKAVAFASPVASVQTKDCRVFVQSGKV
jgi:hypothetical protein